MRCLCICAAGLSLSTVSRRACSVARSVAGRSLTGKTPQSVFSAVCRVRSLTQTVACLVQFVECVPFSCPCILRGSCRGRFVFFVFVLLF